MPEVYPGSPTTAVAPPRGLLMLALATVLGFFCTAGVHAAFTVCMGQMTVETGAQCQQLLADSTLLGTLLLPVAGWLADTCWGPRSTLRVGSCLIFLAGLGIAMLASRWEMALFAEPSARLPLCVCLVGLSLGEVLLMLSVLTLAGLRYRAFNSVFGAFLVIQLVRAPVAACLPLLFGIGFDNFGLAFGLQALALVAGISAALLLRWPRPHPTDTVATPLRHLPAVAALVLSLGLGTWLLQSPYGSWLLYGLGSGAFVGLLVYLAVRFPAQPKPLVLLKPVLGSGAAMWLLTLAIQYGYGIENHTPGRAVAHALMWALIPMLVLALGVAATRRLDGQRATRLLLRGFGLIAGTGLLLIAVVWLLQRFTAFDPLASGPAWVPVALLLHLGTFGLNYLLPVLVSQRAAPAAMGRYMALVLLVELTAAGLAQALMRVL